LQSAVWCFAADRTPRDGLAVLIEFAVQPTNFDLGRIFRVEEVVSIDFESHVSIGGRSEVPFLISAASEIDRDGSWNGSTRAHR